MKQVKCRSEIMGWQCRLRDNYVSFDEFRSMAQTYGLHKRLGFVSPLHAWQANPLVQGSTVPSDFCLVGEIKGKQYGYRSSALRAIRNFCRKHNRKQDDFLVNQVDEGCHEIESRS